MLLRYYVVTTSLTAGTYTRRVIVLASKYIVYGNSYAVSSKGESRVIAYVYM